MDTPRMIKVMLVDDHNVVRSGLVTFLHAYDDLELVAEARNGLEALDRCRIKKPDVILMDLMMPVMDGIAATKAILAENPEIKKLHALSGEGKNYSFNLPLKNAVRIGKREYSIELREDEKHGVHVLWKNRR